MTPGWYREGRGKKRRTEGNRARAPGRRSHSCSGCRATLHSTGQRWWKGPLEVTCCRVTSPQAAFPLPQRGSRSPQKPISSPNETWLGKERAPKPKHSTKPLTAPLHGEGRWPGPARHLHRTPPRAGRTGSPGATAVPHHLSAAHTPAADPPGARGGGQEEPVAARGGKQSAAGPRSGLTVMAGARRGRLRAARAAGRLQRPGGSRGPTMPARSAARPELFRGLFFFFSLQTFFFFFFFPLSSPSHPKLPGRAWARPNGSGWPPARPPLSRSQWSRRGGRGAPGLTLVRLSLLLPCVGRLPEELCCALELPPSCDCGERTGELSLSLSCPSPPRVSQCWS